MNIRNILILITVIFAISCKNEITNEHNISNPDKDGYLPDEASAIKVAEAVWLPIYGSIIYKEKPFHATLKYDSIWVVEGNIEKDHDGGTLYAEIQKKDCKVLIVTHSK